MTEAAPPGSIVCAVDGSASSMDAVAWAASEAGRRDAPLVLVHAWQFPLYHVPLDSPVAPEPDVGLKGSAEEVLSEAERRARELQPSVEVFGRLVTGGASGAILEVAEHASMIVLGSRGLGGVTGLLVGSVGVQVSAHANCPVVVIRRDDSSPGPHPGQVVVGVDGSEPARAALTFAMQEAERLEAGVTAVAIFHPPTVIADAGASAGFSLQDLESATARMLDEEVDAVRERFPAVAVTTRVIESSSGWALVKEAAGCELLVVGSRGHGGFAGLLLGSVSQYALHHARCPVAVIRASEHGDDRGAPSGGDSAG